MRALVLCSVLVAVAGSPTVATSAPEACADAVKRTLTNSKWRLQTAFNRGKPGDWPVTTTVAPDGKMSVTTRRGSLPITCRGKVITFDWSNDASKRYTLTLDNPGMFSGARAGSHRDYDATMKKL